MRLSASKDGLTVYEFTVAQYRDFIFNGSDIDLLSWLLLHHASDIIRGKPANKLTETDAQTVIELFEKVNFRALKKHGAIESPNAKKPTNKTELWNFDKTIAALITRGHHDVFNYGFGFFIASIEQLNASN